MEEEERQKREAEIARKKKEEEERQAAIAKAMELVITLNRLTSLNKGHLLCPQMIV